MENKKWCFICKPTEKCTIGHEIILLLIVILCPIVALIIFASKPKEVI